MASAIDSVILDPVENALDAVGLMQGPFAPVKRTVVGGAIGAGIVFGLQPALAFNEDGSLRPWSLTSSEPDATPVPWWLMVAFPAFVLGILI